MKILFSIVALSACASNSASAPKDLEAPEPCIEADAGMTYVESEAWDGLNVEYLVNHVEISKTPMIFPLFNDVIDTCRLKD